MYIIGASGVWNKEHRTVSSYMFNTRIKNGTIQRKDGSFKYLGNEILNDGMENIPEYHYRRGNRG